MVPVNLGPRSQICCELLTQCFGEIAGQIGCFLFRRGSRPLYEIAASTGLNVSDVKKSLAILIQHNLVTFQSSAKIPDIAEYSINSHEVYCLLRYPRYLYMIKTLFGDESEMLLEELISQGQSSASNLIFRASKRLSEALEGASEIVSPLLLYEKLQNLAIYHFIVRCRPIVSTDKKVPEFAKEDDKEHTVPPVDFKFLSQKIKENVEQLGDHSDINIVWRINCERFDLEMRNVILLNTAARRVDSHAEELLNLIFQLARQVDHPLTAHEIRDAARKKLSPGPVVEYCDQYLQVLSEDSSELLVRVGDSGGGQYSINYGNVFKNLACATLDSIILERFGTKAARLFRLTRSKQYLEQDQMQQLSMIPAKEAKMFTYRLLEQNFLQLRELRKGTGNSAPVKTFFLFHVDIQQVVRTALETTLKGLFNALIRREYELGENKRLLDKQSRVGSILVSLREQGATEEQLNEVEEMITPPEKGLLARIHSSVDRLTQGQMQVDETVLILESYLKFNPMK